MFLKIFLAAITVCSLLGCLGANRRDNKRLAAVKKEATITGKGDAWGTITIKDDTGETREYYWKEKEKE